ncbi:MAG: response regulator [Myxococcota bacterium]
MSMRLKLDYSNKYTLWMDLILANADRLFVEADRITLLGTEVPLEIAIQDLGLRLVVRGNVVATRRQSRRFPQGVFLQIPDRELRKCQRFLGLDLTESRWGRMRRASRVFYEAPVRFVEPEVDGPCVTMNISTTGLYVVGVTGLLPGQRVKLELTLEGKSLEVEAEVAWATPPRKAVGLQLYDLPTEAAAMLLDTVRAASASFSMGERPDPILVAESDPEVTDFLSKSMSKYGYELFQAKDAEEAMGLVRELKPKLVLMDILMPQIDAVGITHTMRGDAELADIPVIFAAALDDDVLAAIADNAGASDYVRKPVSLAELLDLVGSYLNIDGET